MLFGVVMSMFSASKSLFEIALAGKLRERFDKISARNKLIARWAFRKTKLPKEEMEPYVFNIIRSYILAPSDARLIFNIVDDLTERNVKICRSDVIRTIRKIEKKLKFSKGIV